ncbi:MAG TPA: tryptophan halogenase family protein [Burkholderiaceae bacterium]
MNPIKSILIVGGGTAGWLTAAFLARTLGTARGGPQITLVESTDIGTIGVGEATFPSIKGTLAAIGIPEAEFLRESNASFKQGIRYNHWVRPPGTPSTSGQDFYFHPFSVPSQRPNGPELLPYWLMGGAGPGVPFAEAVTLQKHVTDAMRGPKRLSDADYVGPMNYAYHFDAGRFAALLAKHGRAAGVQHVIATMERAERAEDGAIAAVHTIEAGALRADLYIDCTGFRGALIGDALGSRFISASHMLFNDRALAMQVPYARPDAPIAPYTIATAQECGWTWDIGLQERRGVGYCYSSRHTDDARAEQVLREHIRRTGGDPDQLEARKLKLNVGHREAQWVRNCVAIGLSSGFLEPLESSGIGLIETGAYLLGYLLPQTDQLESAAQHFNAMMGRRYERIIDFLKLHYCLTKRTDTAYWRDNVDPASCSPALLAQLAQWRQRPPHRLDFFTDFEMYPPTSWQYVLYGMEFKTELSALSAAAYPRMAEARDEFATLRQVAQHALKDLPDHRALVEAMKQR